MPFSTQVFCPTLSCSFSKSQIVKLSQGGYGGPFSSMKEHQVSSHFKAHSYNKERVYKISQLNPSSCCAKIALYSIMLSLRI